MDYFDILLARKLANKGDITTESLSVTENGTYTAPSGKAYSPVTVEVEPPENSYQLKSITTPTSLATFNASAMPMPTLKVSVEAKQAGSGVPSPENVRPISGWDAVVVSDVGKNLFDKNAAEAGKVLNRNTGETTTASGWSVSDYVKIKENTTYTYSDDGISAANGIIFCYYDSNKNFISGIYDTPRVTRTITTPSNAVYVRFEIRSGALNVLQFELGSTATEYEPYINQTTTISLPQTVYGGELDVVNGTSGNKITYGFVDLSTLTGWLKGNNDRFATSALSDVIADVESTSTVADLMCSHYEPVSFNDANTRHMGIYEHPNKSIGIYDESMSDYTVEQFLAAISGVQLRYPLATPTTLTTQPTPIKSLNGQNNLSVDCGEVIEGEYFIAL